MCQALCCNFMERKVHVPDVASRDPAQGYRFSFPFRQIPPWFIVTGYTSQDNHHLDVTYDGQPVANPAVILAFPSCRVS